MSLLVELNDCYNDLSPYLVVTIYYFMIL